ncbi:MFS transporter [Nocardia yamanashiensis]|uniref:MFS transporter n=1 Tax=Nocardia yamanashiensis TaxID=209247 RepID=UPI001E5802C9|nr:MFS transporter [Nocardia yamanashiensis]UGT39444.1 MFS transporter [Nocardia yamanashiensis]
MTTTSVGQAVDTKPDDRSQANLGLTLLALCAAGLVVSLQQTVVIPLLPRMIVQLHTDVSGVTWLFTASLLTGAVCTPLLSRFGDMYGKKPMVMTAMGVLILGSVICAFATTLGVYIVGRALQGISAAMIPLAIGIIRDTFPPERLVGAIGVVSGTMGVGGTVGLLATGIIADHTQNPHPVFWLTAGLGVVATVLIQVSAKNNGVRHGGKPDFIGAALLAGLLVCLLLGISEGPRWGWGSSSVIGLFVAAAVLTVVWVLMELKVSQPLVRLPLLVGPQSLSANVASALLGFAMFGSFTLISNFIQTPADKVGYGLSGSVLAVGLYGIPSAALMTFFSFRTGRIAAKIGPAYTLAIGAAFAGASMAWLAISHDHGYDMVISQILQGTGFGIGYAALGTLAVQHVPMSESGIASGINSLVRTAGGSIAGAVTASILSAHLIAGTKVPSVNAYVASFAILSVGAFLTAAVAVGHGLRHKGE